MGTEDEHWCNICKHALDKKKDKYVEFELVNAPLTLVRGKPKKPKGIICQKCIDADPKLKEALELISKAGNPNFILSIQCISCTDCETYEPSKQSGINCQHITVIEDKLYCKRSHPGILKLPREKAEVDKLNRRLVLEHIQKFIKDPKVREIMNTDAIKKQLETIYFPPSSIIEPQHPDLPQGEEKIKCPKCFSKKIRMMWEAPERTRQYACGDCSYQWSTDVPSGG